MTEHDAIVLFKCLADATRLQILKTLHQGPQDVELLAQRLDRTPSTISFHLKKLEEAGLVRGEKAQYYMEYRLREDALAVRIVDVICAPSAQQGAQEERERLYRQKVLDSFFRYGKLTSIPAQKKKERIVLEKIAESFLPGRQYTEREVNLIIADFHDDFCTIRRDMVGEGLLARDRGRYWLVGENGPRGEQP